MINNMFGIMIKQLMKINVHKKQYVLQKLLNNLYLIKKVNVYNFVMEIMQLLQLKKEQNKVEYVFKIVDFIINKFKIQIINSVHINKISVQK